MRRSSSGLNGWFVGTILPLAISMVILQQGPAQGETVTTNSAAASQPAKKAKEEAKRLVALGDQSARGKGVQQDERQAAEYYAKAAELGDPTGQLRFGEALVYGRGIGVNRALGVSLIEAAVQGGSSAAMVSLGDVIVRGLAGPADAKRATGLFERAAAEGQAVALVKLGALFEAGAIVNKDARRAAEYYRKAIAADRTDAMVSLGRALAEGRLKGQGSPAEGIALLRKARELGNENAVLALSDCYLNGKGVAPSPRKALALLKEAWREGNSRAGLRLVALYRDGRSKRVAPNTQRADAYFEEVAPKLTAGEKASERLLLDAKQAMTRAQRRAAWKAFSDLPASDKPGLIRRVYSTDRNVYVFLVQAELNRRGLLKHRPTGVLSGATVRAIYRNCTSYQKPDICREGPLTPRVLETTSYLFHGAI
jgi:TPR repeat protein